MNTQTIEIYYASPRISNSSLSAVQNPRILKLKRENPELFEGDDTVSLRVGSALDCLLTSPDRWDKDFRVINVNKPYGLMGKFVSALDAGLTKNSDQSFFEDAYWKSGYKMPLDWVINKFWTTAEAVEYYTTVKGAAKDVTILSKDEYDSVKKAQELVLASPYAYSYFIKNRTYEELHHQVAIYFVYEEQDFKALLDGVKVDHKNKTIQPFDLKTTGKNVYQFESSYLEYGYYRQAALYDWAIRSEWSPFYELIKEGYVVLDFIFIVVETKLSSYNPAIIYRTTEEERKFGFSGGEIRGKKYPGICTLLEDYLWHVKTDQWTYPREVYLNNGEMPLKVFS